jgi:MFS family permease
MTMTMASAGTPASEVSATSHWPSARSGWLMTAAMTTAYILSFLDRQIVNLLAPAIKRDLRLSDVELSLLQGAAFAVPFVTLGLIAGVLADRGRRTRIVAVGMGVWSFMTSLCGIAGGFAALFGCRAGVGVGEAMLGPAAVSLISDQFPPPVRPRALAVYNLGTTLGAALGYIVIAQLIPSQPVPVPLLGLVAPWKATFLLLGIPGLIFAGSVLLLEEPTRRGLMNATGHARGAATGYRTALKFIASRRDVFVPLFIGMGCLGLVVYGPASQTTLFFTRTFGWTIKEVGRISGLLLLATGVPGALFGGFLAARLRRKHANGTLRAIVYATLLLIVPATITWILPNPAFVWIGIAVQNFAIASSINLGTSAIADVTPNELRGKVVALFSIMLTLLGLGLGPTIIAMITQYALHDEKLIRYSLVIFSAVVAPVGAVALIAALKPFQRVVQESQTWTGVES